MSFIGNAISDITGGSSLTGNTAVQNPMVQNFQTNAGYQQQLGTTQQDLGGQLALQNQLASQNGIANQSQVYQQQQQLAGALAAQAAGTGINPVQMQLNQNTGQNVAQQGALMASQRGASANPALIARLAAQQGAQIQQNAAGQAATLGAQQQLQGQQELQAQQGLLANTATGQVNNLLGNQNSLIGNQQALTNSTLGAIGGQNTVQAGIQNTQQSGQNTLNSNTTQFVPNLLSAAGGASSLATKAYGGEIENPKLAATAPSHRYPARISLPPHLDSVAKIYHNISYENQLSNPGYEGEKYARGGNVGTGLKQGGKVPGEANVKGDSLSNDIVDAKLSPGEVVLPRSVMQAKDPAAAAAEFVRGLQSKKGKSKDPKGDFKKALSSAMAGRKK